MKKAVSQPPSQLVSASQLAAEFGLQPRFLQKLAEAGSFPKPIRFGKRLLRFSRAQVQAWLDAQACAGTHVGGQK